MFNYGDIIEYLDGTYDENFNEARKWCSHNDASFDELVERRKEMPDGLHRYFQINKYPDPEPSPEPEPYIPTKEDIERQRADRYRYEVDPMTSEINRLRDEEQTPKVMARIAELILVRKETVEKIKTELPYPVEVVEEKHEETPIDVTK